MFPERKTRSLESPPDTLNRGVRLAYIYRNLGFLPGSARELTTAFDLARNSYRGKSVTDRLDAVYKHQAQETDPVDRQNEDSDTIARKSVAAVIKGYWNKGKYYSGYSDYKERSEYTLTQLPRMRERLVELQTYTPLAPEYIKGKSPEMTTRLIMGSIPKFPSSILSESFSFSEESFDKTDSPIPLLSLVRYADLKKMAEEGATADDFGFDPLKVSYSSMPSEHSAVLAAHIQEFLEQTTFEQAMRLTEEAIAEGTIRNQFWQQSSTEADAYLDSLVAVQQTA